MQENTESSRPPRRLLRLALRLALTGAVFGYLFSRVDIPSLRASLVRIPLSGADVFETKSFLILPFTDMFFFATFIGLALLHLSDGAAHKRLMVLATLAILPPAFGRMFPLLGMTEFTPANILVALLLQQSILFLGMLHDRLTTKKIHPVYLWGGISMLVIHLTRIPLGNTRLWQSMAGGLAGL